jgi:hypothetical protein
MKRLYFPDCRVEVAAWAEYDAFVCDDAETWIEDESILVSYFDDEGIVVLEGISDRNDGWVLAARSRPRRATLLPVEGNDRSYVGSIDEQGESASWTLRLGTPEALADP